MESLPADLILPFFSSLFYHPPPRCKRWTALYSVSTGPCSQIRELLMELSLVLVYLVPSHQVQVSLFYRWTQWARAMSYPRSTQQPQNTTKAPTANTIFLLPGKLSNTCFLERGEVEIYIALHRNHEHLYQQFIWSKPCTNNHVQIRFGFTQILWPNFKKNFLFGQLLLLYLS